MNTDTKSITNQVVILIKNDEVNASHFFRKETNPKWLLELEPFGFFNPENKNINEATQNYIKYQFWPQGLYLENISLKIKSKEINDDKFIKYFVNIVRRFYETKENSSIIRRVFKIILNIPLNYITDQDIYSCFSMIEENKTKDYFLEYDVQEGYQSIRNASENNNHQRNIFKAYTSSMLKTKNDLKENIRNEKFVYFPEYGFGSLLELYSDLNTNFESKNYLLIDSVDVLSSKLDSFLTSNEIDSTSSSWRPAIKDHYQNQYLDSAPGIITEILFKISNFLLKKDIAISQVNEWRTSKRITHFRLYVALATENPDSINTNKCAETIIKKGLRSDSRFEIYHFLEKNFDLISKKKQTQFLDLINNLKIDENNKNPEQIKKISAWQKLRWLQAIKKSNNLDAQNFFLDNLNITGSEDENPDFNSYMSTTWIGPTSPWAIDDFQNAEPLNIIEKLKNFKDEDRKYNEPSVEGLSRVFEEYVSKDPVQSSLLIDYIPELSTIFISSFYQGYSKAWSDKKSNIPVPDLLKLALDLLSNTKYISEVSDLELKNQWHVSAIFRFISEGIRNDSNAFDSSCNPLCYKIIELAINVIKPNQEYNNSSDAHTRAINEPRGIIFETAILLSLREARIIPETHTNVNSMQKEIRPSWENLYNIIYPTLTKGDNSEISLYAHLGSLYRQLLFLNDSWVYDNLDLICPKDPSRTPLWSAFMQGFCYVNAYVKTMYIHLQKRGDLLSFLRLRQQDQKDVRSRIGTLQERIIELSIISFLLKDETIGNGLLRDILDYQDIYECHYIISSLPRLVGKAPKKEILERSKELIIYLFDLYESDSLSEKKDLIFDGVSRLLPLFSDPSNFLVRKIINAEISNKKEYDNYYPIILYMEKYSSTHAQVVGDLFYYIIENSKSYPTYPEEKIKSILNNLKTNKQTIILAKITKKYSDNYPHSSLAIYANTLI